MMQHKSSSSGNTRVLSTEEYDPYLGLLDIGMRQLPGDEGEVATGEPPVATEPGAGGGKAAPGADASPGGADAGGSAGGTEAMSMSMPTAAEEGDQGFFDTVGDKIKDLTGQSG